MSKLSLVFFLILAIGSQRLQGQTGEQLEAAYAVRSKEKLQEFIDAWANEHKPASAEERKQMRRPIQQAYGVVEAFFTGYKLADHELEALVNDRDTMVKYFVVQNKFDIFQRDKVYYTEEEGKKYAIDNILKNVEKKYHESFIRSIKAGSKSLAYGYGPDVNSIWADSVRVRILSKFLPVFPSDWRGWTMASVPKISALIFDKDFRYAKIEYLKAYEGGEAFLEYRDNEWKLISMRRTWIQ
ncbi:hypothetical protein [Pedobacter sp. JY14-1]|uniref:hypothetical protein n=1 Tax=Pedobacter sp. JY14-1 TaxID=3034151 RepID=UPI0023E2A879|nr:hypothetical protein [Pedobacter sp. JY14-1]